MKFVGSAAALALAVGFAGFSSQAATLPAPGGTGYAAQVGTSPLTVLITVDSTNTVHFYNGSIGPVKDLGALDFDGLLASRRILEYPLKESTVTSTSIQFVTKMTGTKYDLEKGSDGVFRAHIEGPPGANYFNVTGVPFENVSAK